MKPKWKNEEIKKLFNIVEKNNTKGKTMLDSFKEYANISSKQVLSIRNFYYSFLKELKANKELQNKLKIDISKHYTQNFEHFNCQAENELLQKIVNLTKNGMSVRSACLTIANGDYKTMLRYQNKYRSLITKNAFEQNNTNSKKVSALSKFLKEQNLNMQPNIKILNNKTSYIDEKINNKNICDDSKNMVKNKKISKKMPIFNKNLSKNATILQFPKNNIVKNYKEKLSDDDIKSLFLGLVGLVKDNAKNDSQKRYEAYLEKTQEDNRRHFIELEQKQLEIEKLKQNINELKQKNLILNKSLQEYRIDYLNNNQNS